MTKEKAEIKAKVYNSMTKHPDLSYAAVKKDEFEYAVGQFLKGEQVALVA
jgi:hypothetical protein